MHEREPKTNPEQEQVPTWHINDDLSEDLAWLPNPYQAQRRDQLLEKGSDLDKWELSASAQEKSSFRANIKAYRTPSTY